MDKIVKMGVKETGVIEKDYWQTPQWLKKIIKDYYGGTYFDPCPANPDFDGLKLIWPVKDTYINPPFSQYKAWVNHGLLYSKRSRQIWLSHHNHDVVWFKQLRVFSVAQVQLFSRIRFEDYLTGEPSKSTAYGKCQTLHFLGGHDIEEIKKHFSTIGQVMIKA